MKPLLEKEDDLLKPINSYTESKKSLENIVISLGKYLNIPVVALRYSIVHGPRQSFKNFYSGALRQFSTMALSGGLISMHEDGCQLRDFVNYQDVVNANLIVLENSKADFQIFNVASGIGTRVFDLAKLVADECELEFKYELNGLYRVATPRNSIADVSKLKSLGWKPQFTVKDNVRDYVTWIKNYPEAKKYLKIALANLVKNGVVQKAKKV